jgi:hypothetical protein
LSTFGQKAEATAVQTIYLLRQMNALHKKLRLKADSTIAQINGPDNFADIISGDLEVKKPSKKCDAIFWFCLNRTIFEEQLTKVTQLLSDTNIIWILYPKGTSGIQTDLNRDNGWDMLMKQPNITFISLISIDKIWSAFAIRTKRPEDDKRAAKSEQREIFKYADSATKTITLPEDLEKAFKKNAPAKRIFDALSFSCRREYVEWVITAKRPETRAARLEGTMQKLLQGWKNPAGRP